MAAEPLLRKCSNCGRSESRHLRGDSETCGSFAPKPKQSFMGAYKHAEDGHAGSPADWRSAFKQRMGLDEALAAVKNSKKTPRGILGVGRTAIWEEIKSAYRKLARQHHPDLGGDAAEFRNIQAAYEVLEDANNRAV